MNGVVIGKFYPPHRGHKFLIDTAASSVDQLTVIVCDHPDQTIPGEVRAAWLREIHPKVRVVVSPDNLPDAPSPWAERTIEILGRRPDVVFTSEGYGEGYAHAMRCRHILVDRDRVTVPISGTAVRENPLDNLDFLEPCVRAHFVKRIVLIGVESTGKTTLAQQLAKALSTEWVPEYGREYSLNKSDAWRTEDFVEIAHEQQRRENLAAQFANRYLICDTNAFATGLWNMRYMGYRSAVVDAIGERDKVDLFLVTMPDFPFVQDGTRDGENIRHAMHTWLLSSLSSRIESNIPLAGSQDLRLSLALQAINSIRK